MLREQINELLGQRMRLVKAGRELYEKAKTEKRGLTSEEQTNDDARLTEITELTEQIRRMERQLELEREVASSVVAKQERAVETAPDADLAHRARLTPYANRLSSILSSDGRLASTSMETRASKAYTDRYAQYLRGEASATELRALSVDSATGGGYLVAPLQMTMDLIQAIDDQVFIRRLATKYTVVNAEGIGIPSLDADPADADWTAEELTGSEDSTMAFGRREMKPYPLAKRIKVSQRLIRSATQSVEELVRTRLAYKFAVTEEKAFLTGSGAGQPLGVFTASADGVPTSRDVVTGSTTDFTFPGLFDAKYMLKGAYHGRPTTAWLFHRDGLKRISKLVDTQNRPLWEPSLQVGQPDRLLGIPVFMSEYAPNTFTTGQYVGMLADWSYYVIADSLNFGIQRLVELYAEKNQIGYIGRIELDGAPVLAEAFVRIKTS